MKIAIYDWYHGSDYDYVVYNTGSWGVSWSCWIVPGTIWEQ